MAIKLVVTNEQDKDIAKYAIELFKDMMKDSSISDILDEEFKEEYVDAAEEFLDEVTLTQEAANLDTALMQEIGKAYRFEYDKAKEAGDEKLAERHLGAMLAIKRLMDMVQPPKY